MLSVVENNNDNKFNYRLIFKYGTIFVTISDNVILDFELKGRFSDITYLERKKLTEHLMCWIYRKNLDVSDHIKDTISSYLEYNEVIDGNISDGYFRVNLE
jgi:hypothetical protein